MRGILTYSMGHTRKGAWISLGRMKKISRSGQGDTVKIPETSNKTEAHLWTCIPEKDGKKAYRDYDSDEDLHRVYYENWRRHIGGFSNGFM